MNTHQWYRVVLICHILALDACKWRSEAWLGCSWESRVHAEGDRLKPHSHWTSTWWSYCVTISSPYANSGTYKHKSYKVSFLYDWTMPGMPSLRWRSHFRFAKGTSLENLKSPWETFEGAQERSNISLHTNVLPSPSSYTPLTCMYP